MTGTYFHENIFQQIALTDLLTFLGIIPDGIIGHSVGEMSCAYADGSLTLEEAILLAYYRGLASLESNGIHGLMAAVGKTDSMANYFSFISTVLASMLL